MHMVDRVKHICAVNTAGGLCDFGRSGDPRSLIALEYRAHAESGRSLTSSVDASLSTGIRLIVNVSAREACTTVY